VATKLRGLYLSIMLGVTVVVAAAQQNDTLEQRHFSAEDESVRVPVEIPQGVRKILDEDEMVREATRHDHIDSEKFPEAWFSATIVHLGSSSEEDLVVVGQGPMLGANITHFWVFRGTDKSFRLVLRAGAHDLIVTNKVSNGFRNIQLLSATGTRVHTVVLQFDGDRYELMSDTWEPIQ
jgi:hypothetical protein